jgi:hypothetical protein
VDNKYCNTYCIGRFLIDCPHTAIITERYGKIWGKEFVWRKDLTPDTARQEAFLEIDKFKKIPHKEVAGSMYVDVVELPNKGIALVRWQEPHSDVFLTYQCYFVAPEIEMRVFSVNLLGLPDSQNRQYILKRMEDIAFSLRSLNDGEIPTEPGFCFEGGISLHTGEWRAEHAGIHFTLPDAPGTVFALDIHGTGVEGIPLLSRGDIEVVLQDALRPGVRVLRRGKVMLGDIVAEELVRIDASRNHMWHENILYDFVLEAPDFGKRLDRPGIYFAMNNYLSLTQEISPFRSDEEALDLWDAVTRSIRLRPGAV